jgi:PIN domain nuclease of toxin-antitoxin system
MNYLLDTHSFLWALFEDERLSRKVRETIKNPENEIYASIITYWEISLKYSIGKLKLHGITPKELPGQAKQVGIETLYLSEHQASTFHLLPKINHKDPFDRLITWQSISTDIILISKDEEIKKYKRHGLKILW